MINKNKEDKMQNKQPKANDEANDQSAHKSVAGNKNSLFIAKDHGRAFVDRTASGKAPAKISAFFGAQEAPVDLKVAVSEKPETVESATDFLNRKIVEIKQLERAASTVSKNFSDREMAFFAVIQTKVCEVVLSTAQEILPSANNSKGFHP